MNAITAGCLLSYKQKLSERPRNPQRIWRGVVTTIIHIQGNIYLYEVQSIEAGYEGLEEYVFTDQIVSYEPPTQQAAQNDTRR